MKNLLLLLAMLITSSTVFSQLYVKPNGSTDSYVYVKDEVLFVEDDINLQENNAGTEQASIYLREGSQLIQGSGSTLNSGDGYISIYQTIDETSNYHYNFWHSPVGNQDLGGSGNQNAGVSRLYDVNDVTDSDLVATTTAYNGSSTTDPITVSTRWIYTRTSSPANEQEGNYHHIGANDNIAAGYGFTMKGVSDGAVSQSQEYDFRGRPNNGTISVPVGSGTQWTLSGNPYPSALDLKEFFWANDTLANNNNNGLTGILFWDEPKDSEFSHNYAEKSGGYGVWIPGPDNTEDDPGVYTAPTFKDYTANGGIGAIGSVTGPAVDRRYSPVGQGFVLRTTNVSADNVVIQNDQRVFKKIGEVSEIRIQENENDPAGRSSSFSMITPQIRINMVFNDTYARQLLLLFHDESTDGYDVGLDGHHPMDSGGAEAYYLIEENNEMGPFVIQTRPFSAYNQIPIGFSLDTQTKIVVNTIEILELNRTAYFWDSVNDTYKKLSANPSEYLDTGIILPAGVYNDRFYIVFKNNRELLEESEGTKEIEIAKASVGFFQNNPYQQMEVSNPEGYDIKSAAIYDMTGKLVATKHNVGTVSNFNIPTSNLSDGVYLVKLTTIENINIDYKTIIQNN